MEQLEQDIVSEVGGESAHMFRHGILVLFLFHIGSISNLAFQLIAGRTLSRGEYGTLYAMLGFLMVFMIPMQALQTTLGHFARHLDRDGRRGDIIRLVRLWERKLFFILLPALLILFLFSGKLAVFFNLDSGWPLVLVFASAFIFAFLQVYAGAFQGMQSFVAMSLSTNGWGVAKMLLGWLAFVFIAPLAISGLTAHMLGNLLFALAAVAMLRASLKPKAESADMLEGTDKYFIMSMLSLLAFSVLMNGDVVLVKILFKAQSEYGDYTRASAVTRMMIFLVQPLALALFPKVASKGISTRGTRRTLMKALLFSALILILASAFCALVPRIPLAIIFGDIDSLERPADLIRLLAFAMAPLGIAFMLLNYELAQHRFRFLIGLGASALLFVLGVFCFHPSIWSVAVWLAISSYSALILLLLDLFCFQRKPS